MAQWQRTLNLLPEWDGVKEGSVSFNAMASTVAQRLKALKPFSDQEIEEQKLELVDAFECMSEDPSTDVDDFDCVMSDLYDWADTQISGSFFDAKKVCWVKTF